MTNEKNYVQQLAEYVKTNINKGYTMDSLRIALVRQGYSKVTIDNAINLANNQLASQAPAMKEKPQITHKYVLDEEIKPKKKSFFERLFG